MTRLQCIFPEIRKGPIRWMVGMFGVSLPASNNKVHNLKGSFRKRRVGAAVVEFAIVAPVFMLLVFGMIEYGRMVMVQQMLTNAAREGARKAVLEGATEDAVETIVREYLESGNISVEDSEIGVSFDPGNNRAAVSISVPFTRVSWLPTPLYLGGRALNASSTMRLERVE